MRQQKGQIYKNLYIYMCKLENNVLTMSNDQQRV